MSRRKAPKCRKCKCLVCDGVNGDVYEPPPWAPELRYFAQAYCYACENADLHAAEMADVMRSLCAAARNGRFDLM